ncbi:MAG: M81 family metallopeptidase [Verrucomicrobiae bacterium]|nr:M81 family metallopeptidase [Verrucomicrobiae bacterium]
MRIAVGGIHIESCTFSPLRAGCEDFTLRRGDELLARYPFLDQFSVEAIPLVHARALPGGMVLRDFYQAVKQEFLDRLADAGNVDGVYLDIHGAMNVDGIDDAEADFARAVRACVGDMPLISASMDLHGNVSGELVGAVDIFTAYRTAPHIDVEETRKKAFRLLVECLKNGTRPLRAWVSVPVILPGERTSTIAEPGRAFYRSIEEFDPVPGVLDASFWVGYVWADEPRVAATAVVTGTDPVAIKRTAETLADRYWKLREEFEFGVDADTAEACIERAVSASEKLVIISDSGDNPTGGGAGDVPVMVETLLTNEHLATSGLKALYASMPGPVAIQLCFEAGEGNNVSCEVGGELDPVHGYPITLSGTVKKLHTGDLDALRQAVLECGHVTVILTERRKPFHHIRDFTELGLDLADFKILSVKVGYLVPELEQAADLALLALTPGSVNQDIPALEHKRVKRPVYPIDTSFEWAPVATLFGETAEQP